MSCKTGTNVTSLLNEMDTILSGSEAPVDQVKAGTILTAALSSPATDVAPPALFSTYLLSPAYFTQTPDLLLVKLVTAKGEPFYLLDPKKEAMSIVCGLTEIFLAPYDPDTACVDECEGLPALHIVPDCVVRELLTRSLKGICTAPWFSGIVFVSSVGLQFYYKTCDGSMTTSVYRVAADRDGHIEAREVRGVVTCDYPVPYLLVDEGLFAGGSHSVAIVESLPQANASLIDALCRIEYATLHSAEEFADELDGLLKSFMGNHSNLVKNLLEAQKRGVACDDAFIRRQRKNEIDTLVRLMMREIDLVRDLKKTLEEMAYVEKAVVECPPCSPTPAVPPVPVPDCGPAPTVAEKSERLMTSTTEIAKIIQRPLSECSDDDSEVFAHADMIGSPSSGSECSR